MARIALIIVLLATGVNYAQKSHVIHWASTQDPVINLKQHKRFSQPEALRSFVSEKRFKLIKKGFVLTSIDSIIWRSDTAFVHLYIGEKFDKLSIDIESSDQDLIRKVPGVNERMLTRVRFNAREIGATVKRISDHLRDHGYPFARVGLRVESISSPVTFAMLFIDEGPLVTIKKIHIKGSADVRKKFVVNAIALKEGDLYEQSRLNDISSRINQIQFLKEVKPHELLFTEKGVEVFIYLESNPVSLVNGVVGLQPDPVTQENIITGDVRLKLQNVLNRGELFDVNWRSLQPTTQDLDLQLTYPFLFNTPFGIDSKFELYKQDSSFLTTNLNLGIQYFLRGGNYIKAFYESDNSNVLSGGTNAPENFVSVSTNRYGLGVFRRQFDYLPNPSRGFSISLEASAGQRTSSQPGADSLTQSTTFKGDLNITAFIPLSRRHVIRLANQTRTYYAPEIYSNEAFRFGGLQSQRGFNEELLRATTLSTFTIEYRFLVDRNSHVFAFFDQTIYENTINNYSQDEPFGFGAGFSFGTNIGIFSISYALGQQFDNPILLRDGKVHFGYVAYF